MPAWLGLFAAAAIALASPQPSAPSWPSPCPESDEGYVLGQVLVAFDAKATPADRAAFKKRFGVIAERPMGLPGTWVMRVPCEADVPALCKRMAKAKGVRYAEPDAVIKLDDPVIDAPSAN